MKHLRFLLILVSFALLPAAIIHQESAYCLRNAIKVLGRMGKRPSSHH